VIVKRFDHLISAPNTCGVAGDIDRARGEQEALAQICKRRPAECVGYARILLDEIEGSRQGNN